MEILNSILRITMIVLLFRAIFAIATSIAVSKKMKQTQQSAVHQNTANINKQLIEQKEKLQAELLEQMVRDDYCGKMIEKNKAYIIRIDDHLRHFCSWECRQNYIHEAG